MTLVNDDELPVDLRQHGAVLEHHLVTGANHRKTIRGSAFLIVSYDFGPVDFASFFRRAMVHDYRNRGGPHMELVHPV